MRAGSQVGKASSVLLAACYSGRKADHPHFLRSLIESCRAWLLPEGQKANVIVLLGSNG